MRPSTREHLSFNPTYFHVYLFMTWPLSYPCQNPIRLLSMMFFPLIRREHALSVQPASSNVYLSCSAIRVLRLCAPSLDDDRVWVEVVTTVSDYKGFTVSLWSVPVDNGAGFADSSRSHSSAKMGVIFPVRYRNQSKAILLQ